MKKFKQFLLFQLGVGALCSTLLFTAIQPSQAAPLLQAQPTGAEIMESSHTTNTQAVRLFLPLVTGENAGAVTLTDTTTDGSHPVADGGSTAPEAQDANHQHQAVVTLPGHRTPTEVSYEVRDGLAIFEGDIILGEVDAAGELIQPVEASAVAIEGESYLWPNGVIPYHIADNLSNDFVQVSIINAAIQNWEDNTDIDLVPWTTQSAYVEFVLGTTCESSVGRRGLRQEVVIGSCDVGNVIHEIGHAVGLWHEQSREDRDNFVEILSANILPDKAFAFAKHITDGFDIGSYDYNSVMHYGCYVFGKDDGKGGKLQTIKPKDPNVGCEGEPKPINIGVRLGLSAGDIAAVNKLYAFFNRKGHEYFCVGQEVCAVGDINGDGKDDIVDFLRSTFTNEWQGDVNITLSNGQTFGGGQKWHDYFCVGNEQCALGDVNGDGKDDLIDFLRDSFTGALQGDVNVALSNGTSFGAGQKWHDFFCVGQEVCLVGDVNGDGKDDVVRFLHGTGDATSMGFVKVALSNGASFGSTTVWHNYFCVGNEVCALADVNGDGKDDLVDFLRDSFTGALQGDVNVALSTGTSFGAGQKWHDYFCIGQERCAVGDVNGDGKDDIITFLRDTSGLGEARGDVYVALSTGTGFAQSFKGHGFLCIVQQVCDVGDVNGDGKNDLLQFIGSSRTDALMGDVYIAQSQVR